VSAAQLEKVVVCLRELEARRYSLIQQNGAVTCEVAVDAVQLNIEYARLGRFCFFTSINFFLFGTAGSQLFVIFFGPIWRLFKIVCKNWSRSCIGVKSSQ
jgi:hypothetical protein